MRTRRLLLAVALVLALPACGKRFCSGGSGGVNDGYPTAQAAFDADVVGQRRPRDGWRVKQQSASSVTYRREQGRDWDEVRVDFRSDGWHFAWEQACRYG